MSSDGKNACLMSARQSLALQVCILGLCLVSLARESCSHESMLFIHFPRTGSTAVRSFLSKAWGSSCSEVLYDKLDFLESHSQCKWTSAEYTLGIGSRHLIVRNHLTPELKHMYLGTPFTLTGGVANGTLISTILRHPVDRMLSSYYWMRGTQWDSLNDMCGLLNCRTLSGYLDALAAQKLASWELDNMYTRVFADLNPNVSKNFKVPSLGTEPQVVDSKMLDRAITNFERVVSVFGFTEDMTSYQMLLHSRHDYELSDSPYLTTDRTSTKPHTLQISHSTFAKIVKTQEYDIAFFRKAKELFHKRFSKELEDLYEGNKKYKMYHNHAVHGGRGCFF
jgi:hypothetical protein